MATLEIATVTVLRVYNHGEPCVKELDSHKVERVMVDTKLAKRMIASFSWRTPISDHFSLRVVARQRFYA